MDFIFKYFNQKTEEKREVNKENCMKYMDDFVNKIYEGEQLNYQVNFTDIFIYYYEWLNKDTTFYFHDQYISTLTTSLIAFLQTIKENEYEIKKSLLTKFLTNQLNMIVEDSKYGYYDNPRVSKEEYKY